MERTIQRCFLLAALLILLLFSGCTGKNADNTGSSDSLTNSGAVISPTEQASEKETEEAATRPVSPYPFDRMNCDLSGLLENNTDIDNRPAGDFDVPCKKGEIKLALVDVDSTKTVGRENCVCFDFPELPPLNPETQEQEGFFQESAVSFTIFTTDSAMYDKFYATRHVLNETSWAFVMQSLVKRDYESLCLEDDTEVCYSHIRLFAEIENANGITDTFIVDKDLYILHAEGHFDHSLMRLSDVTEKSTEPLDEYAFLRLFAVALHHIHADVMLGYYSDLLGMAYWREGDPFEHVAIELEYHGKTTLLTETDAIHAFVSLLQTYPDNRERAMLVTHARPELELDEALRISVHWEGDDNGGTYYITPEGKYIHLDNRTRLISTYYTYPSRRSVLTRLLLVYSTAETLPFNELIAFVK